MYVSIFATILVSILSAFLIKNISNIFYKIIFVGFVSFTVAYVLYWMPVWLGATSDQYASWAPLVIGICFSAGMASGTLVLLSIKWAKQTDREKNKIPYEANDRK